MKRYIDNDVLSLNNSYSKFKISNSNDSVFVNKHLMRHLSFANSIKKQNLRSKKG